MNPKKDMYGLGFDPFKDAPEFRGKFTIFFVSTFVSICKRDSTYHKHREITIFFCFAERKRAREEDRPGDGGWRGHALSLKRPSLFRPNGKAVYF